MRAAAPAALLARRALGTRPRRTLILLLGYGLGVAVMVALLAVGDALLLQAQDRDLVSGGDLVLLPKGVDPEVLKVGGVGAMFLVIPNARFLARQVLLGPRYAGEIDAVSPEMTNRLVYVRTRAGVSAARAEAALPAAARLTRSALALPAAAWQDTAAERAWLTPDPGRVLESVDRFHAPVTGAHERTWAEWWYFNFAASDGTYGYLAFVADRHRRVRVSTALRLADGRLVRWVETHTQTQLPQASGMFMAGPHRIDLQEGVYRIRIRRPGFVADLAVRPVPHLYLPPLELEAGEFRSGYVVPALRASVTGAIRLRGSDLRVNAIGYHDHNWGTWQGVTWEWGTVSTGELVLLAGLIRHPALQGEEMAVHIFAHGNTRPGLLGMLRGTPPQRSEWRKGLRVRGRPVGIPGRLRYQAVNDAGDRLDVEIAVIDVMATSLEAAGVSGTLSTGEVFLQIRGRYRVAGIVGGRPIRFAAEGFAETFVPLRAPR